MSNTKNLIDPGLYRPGVADSLSVHKIFETNEKPHLSSEDIDRFVELSIPIQLYNIEKKEYVYSPHEIVESFYDIIEEAQEPHKGLSLLDEIKGAEFVEGYTDLVKPLNLQEQLYASELSYKFLFTMKGYSRLDYCSNIENIKKNAINNHSNGVQILSVIPEITPFVLEEGNRQYFETKFEAMIRPSSNLNENTTDNLLHLMNLYLHAKK